MHPDKTIDFPDYNADDLLIITERMLKKDHHALADNARQPLKQYIEECSTPSGFWKERT